MANDGNREIANVHFDGSINAAKIAKAINDTIKTNGDTAFLHFSNIIEPPMIAINQSMLTAKHKSFIAFLMHTPKFPSANMRKHLS